MRKLSFADRAGNIFNFFRGAGGFYFTNAFHSQIFCLGGVFLQNSRLFLVKSILFTRKKIIDNQYKRILALCDNSFRETKIIIEMPIVKRLYGKC